MDAAIARKIEFGAAARAGEADIGEAAFFFQACAAAFIERALVGEEAFFPTGEKHRVKFQPLRAMQRHDRDALGGVVVGHFHDEGDVFEEGSEIREFVHRADEFFQVFQASGAVRRSLFLPHIGVAGFFQNLLGQLALFHCFDEGGPATKA